MKNFRRVCLALSVSCILGALGCSEQAGVKEEKKITSPEGTTTIKKETKIESTGKNPPIDANPSTSPTSTNP